MSGLGREPKSPAFSEYYRNPPDYDIYLSGSDQVWNPLAFSRCNPIYYLDIARWEDHGSRVEFCHLRSSARYLGGDETFLTRFDRISVRENDGTDHRTSDGKTPTGCGRSTFLLTRRLATGFGGQRWFQKNLNPFLPPGTFSYFDWFKEHILEKTRMRPVVIPTRAEDDQPEKGNTTTPVLTCEFTCPRGWWLPTPSTGLPFRSIWGFPSMPSFAKIRRSRGI